MKILHVIPSANPAGGGPIEGVKQLARVKMALGHEVEVATIDPPGSPWLASFPFPIHPLGPGYLGYGYSPKLVPWLRLHASEYDAVIVNGIWQFNSFATWLALRGAGIPYYVCTHGMLDPWSRRRNPFQRLTKSLYWPWAEYRVLRDARAVLFTSEQERLVARKSSWLYRCRECVVPPGADGPVGDPQQQIAAFHEAFPHLLGRHLVLFLGRIHQKKGCRELLHAFLKISSKSNPIARDVHLVMAGPADSPYARRLQAWTAAVGLSHRVTWTGLLSGDLKWGAFRSAEAFILPSHQENFGASVVEALACGVPVLISNRVNHWREIEQDGAGLVDADTVAGTVHLFQRWLHLDASARAHMAANAQACFQQRFEIETAAHSHLDLFQSPG